MSNHGHMLMRCVACGRVLNHAHAKWCKGGKCRARYKRHVARQQKVSIFYLAALFLQLSWVISS